MIYAIIGAAAGVISGMGMGGGTVLIPLLTLFMGAAQQQAQAVNLIAFLPSATVAAFLHLRAGQLEWKRIAPLIAPGLIGALIGVGASSLLPAAALKKAFGAFLLLFAAASWRSAEKQR